MNRSPHPGLPAAVPLAEPLYGARGCRPAQEPADESSLTYTTPSGIGIDWFVRTVPSSRLPVTVMFAPLSTIVVGPLKRELAVASSCSDAFDGGKSRCEASCQVPIAALI